MLSLTAAAILALTAPASDPPEQAAAAALEEMHAAAARSDGAAWAELLAAQRLGVGSGKGKSFAHFLFYFWI
jgi:hypothetical protein